LELAAHKMRKVINLNKDIYSVVFIGQEALEDKVRFDGLNVHFQPIVDFIGDKKDMADGFLEFDYELQQDLLIEMVEKSGQITLIVRYNHRRFRPETIEQYFGHFKTLLEKYTDSMNLRLSQLPPLEINVLDELF
jgi:hypothetical protein